MVTFNVNFLKLDHRMKRETLHKALKALPKASDRQEDVTFDPDLFIDENITTSLYSPNWQIVYGRRGTGKTTILKAFQNAVNEAPDKSIAVYIDLKSCTPSDYGASTAQDTVRMTTKAYFNDFVKHLCRSIYDTYISNKQYPFFQRLINRHFGNKKRIEDIVVEIGRIADFGYHVSIPTEREESLGTRDTTDTRISLDGKVDPSAIEVSANAGLGDTSERNASVKQKFLTQEVGRYKILRDNLKELFTLLDLDRVYFLIDEWTFLDKSASYDIQPIFGELLNRTFGSIGKISIKVSAIRGSTNLYKKKDAGLIGLQPGHDIFEVADLDRLHAEASRNNNFFEQLVYKKLLEVEKKVVCFSKVDENGDPTYIPQEGLIRSLFRRVSVFDEVVEASGKIPRTFIELFKEVAREFNFSISEKWDRKTVMDTIIRKSIHTRYGMDDEGNSSLSAVFEEALRIAKVNNSRVVLTKKSEKKMLGGVISDLFHHELIHPVNPERLPINILDKYDVFYLDYGYFLKACERKLSQNDYSNFKCPVTEDTPQENIDALTVLLANVSASSIICNHCDTKVSSTHPAVVKLGACPICYDKIEVPPAALDTADT